MGLAYERHGAGEPLVLLHGIGHRRQAWYAVLDRLVPQRDVILVDLPGHGASPPLDTRRRSVSEALVADILAFTRELGLARPHFGGNSLGGRIALEAAVRGGAASVTAFSPAGFWTNHRQLTYARDVSKMMEVAGWVARPFGPMLARSTVGRALIYADIVAKPSLVTPEQAMGDMAAFLAARPAINKILAVASAFTGSIGAGIPLTIAWGARDHLLAPRQALAAKARLPQARIVSLPGCGHVPMTDDPALVADVLLRGSEIEPGIAAREGAPALARVLRTAYRESLQRQRFGQCHKPRYVPVTRRI